MCASGSLFDISDTFDFVGHIIVSLSVELVAHEANRLSLRESSCDNVGAFKRNTEAGVAWGFETINTEGDARSGEIIRSGGRHFRTLDNSGDFLSGFFDTIELEDEAATEAKRSL